jgi:hypothetical protein
MEEDLIFANTCGKIYADRVIFAFEHREKVIPFTEIRKVKTGAGIKPKSFFLTLLPSSLLVFLFVIHESNTLLRTIIWFFAIFFTAVSLFTIKRTFHITIVMSGRIGLKINVSGNNKKDAKKFVDLLNRQRQINPIDNPETELRDLAS